MVGAQGAGVAPVGGPSPVALALGADRSAVLALGGEDVGALRVRVVPGEVGMGALGEDEAARVVDTAPPTAASRG